MSRVGRDTVTVLSLALIAVWAGACNNLTGAASYDDVARCTGDTCVKACDLKGGNWDMTTSECTCSCYNDVNKGDLCPPGRTTAPLCGTHCCGDTTDNSVCYVTTKGEPFCGPQCSTPAARCGPQCCEGQTCLNADISACGSTPDYGTVARSCSGGLTCPAPRLDGTTERADCCESIPIPGGTFAMGRSAGGNDKCPDADTKDMSCGPDETPEHDVTLSAFGLDRFEVTVGRFRTFATAWDYKGLPVGAGGDRNLASTGWQDAWNAFLPASREVMDQILDCDAATQTWTHAPGANETRPITCVSWFLAVAFCAWDGGRLPTEAEWEYAASNGAANDLYPWGQDAPKPSLAVYDCTQDAARCATAPALPSAVGSLPGGANTWGHRDLAGNVFEWTLDYWSPYVAGSSTDYFITTSAGAPGLRVYRGGSALVPASYLRAARRTGNVPQARYIDVGFRCARRS